MTYELTPVQTDDENHFALDRDPFAPPTPDSKSSSKTAAQDLTPGHLQLATQSRNAGATSTTRENQ